MRIYNAGLSKFLVCSTTLTLYSVHTTHNRHYRHPTQYKPNCAAIHSIEMSTYFKQWPSYEISISRESTAPDDGTLVESGDLIVRWADGRGRRYRNTTEISDCLLLLDESDIDKAVKTCQKVNTYMPYELGHPPSEGESVLSVDFTPIKFY
jgi:hypothetical protein